MRYLCVLSVQAQKNAAFASKSGPFISYFPKKGCDLPADSSPHQSGRAGGSHLSQSHQKSVALGTRHSVGAGWELVTWSQKLECFRGSEETLFIQRGTRWRTKSCSQLPGGPSISSKQNLPSLLEDLWGFFLVFFFNMSEKRFTCRVTWDNLCVSVCFSS